MTDDDEILAAEYALGLLSPDEATATEARLRTDAPMSLRVAWWRDQLSPLVDEAAVIPSRDLWPQIERRLGANDNAKLTNGWKWATGGMTAVAAGLLGVIVLRPVPVPVTRAPQVVAVGPELVASLSDKVGTTAVTVAYTRESSRLLITPVALSAGRGDAQLWVIPEGQSVPVSLGLIDERIPVTSAVASTAAALITPGATIAISQEAQGGSADGVPHGPIVATGKVIRI